MNVLVIGGTRFMGPHIVRKLSAFGHQVMVFHRGQTRAELPSGVREILDDRDRLVDHAPELRGMRPDVVLDMMLLNQQQARQLVELMTGTAGRLVVASSCDVYLQYDLARGVETGSSASVTISEEAPLRRKLYPYRDSVPDSKHRYHSYDKILVEREIMSESRLPGTVVRLPVVYGPGDYQHRFYGWIKRMLDRRPAIILEEGMAEWRISRGYVENCAQAVALAVTDSRAAGRVYNVGEPQAWPERSWIQRIAEQLNWHGEIVSVPSDRLPEAMRSGIRPQHSLEIGTTRIRAELGFAEPVGADEALSRTIAWERENPPVAGDDPFDYAAEDRILAGE